MTYWSSMIQELRASAFKQLAWQSSVGPDKDQRATSSWSTEKSRFMENVRSFRIMVWVMELRVVLKNI